MTRALIGRKIREAFASQSSGEYFKSKSVQAFEDTLEPDMILAGFIPDGNDVQCTLKIYQDTQYIGDTYFTFYRMPSGRWEIIGYIC